MKKRLALFNIVLLSGTIHAQGVVLNCQQDDGLLFPKQTLSTDDSLNVIADRSEITKKDQYLLTGNVSLNSSEYYLAADRINIKKSSKTSSATGNVKFQDRDLMMIADTAFVQKTILGFIKTFAPGFMPARPFESSTACLTDFRGSLYFTMAALYLFIFSP
jgi:LPS-assembly protein